ncbi:unnamed protein product [Calypogeia fissa]
MSTRPFRKARDSITGELIPGKKNTDDQKSTPVEGWCECFPRFCCCSKSAKECSTLRDEVDGLKDTVSKLTQEKEMWRNKYNEALENHNVAEQAATKMDQSKLRLYRSDHQLRAKSTDLPTPPCSSQIEITKSSGAGEVWIHANAGPGEIFKDRPLKSPSKLVSGPNVS